MSLANGNELHHINLRFEMRPRQQQPPAVRADPLDEAGDVALLIAAILHGAALVAKHQRAEEHLRIASPGKISPTCRCEPVSLAKPCRSRSWRIRHANGG